MICPKCKKEAPEGASYCAYCGRLLGSIQRSKSKRGNRQGTAFRRGSSWTARWTVHSFTDDEGKTHLVRKTKAGFQTKKDALNYCTAHIDLPEKAVPKLIDYWRQYEASRLPDLSADKQCAYKIAWHRWEAIQYWQVDRITTADLQRTVDAQTDTYYPARDMKSIISNLFKLAAADGFVNKDLPTFIRLPKMQETVREAFSDLEQAALWKAYENGCSAAALPLVMIYTGMMPAEVMHLTNDMIDLRAGTITGAGRKTAVRKAAVVYIPDAILPVLQERVTASQQAGTAGPFPHSQDKFYQLYYEALESAKIRRLTPYSCRHTTATALAITEGIAPQTIKQIMRWSTTRMLDRYAHPDDQSVRIAVNSIGKDVANRVANADDI